MDKMSQVFIEFDGQQLVVTSDAPEAIAYFKRTYSRMLASEATNGIGELRVMSSDDGFIVHGSKVLEHPAAIDLLYDHLRREVLLLFVRARPDLLWLHSGAVERIGHAVLISGASTRGKSTIVTQLCARGWNLLSDEAAPMIMETGEVIPFPQMPRRRLYPGKAVATIGWDTFKVEEIEVEADSIRREPVGIGAIVFPEFKAESQPILKRLNSGEAAIEIIRNLMNFVDHKAVAVSQAAGMAEKIPCYSLTYSDGSAAADVVERL